MAIAYGDGATKRTIAAVAYGDGATKRVLKAMFYGDGSTVRKVFTSYTAPVLSGPSTVDWSGENKKPPSTYTTGSGTAVIGGNAATTIQWTRLSGSSAITCDSPNTVGSTFSAGGGLTPGDFISYSAVWRLTYSDGVTTVTKDVTFTFSSN